MHWHDFYEKSNFLHQHLKKSLSSLQVYWIHSSTFSLVFFGADLRYTRTLHLFFGISMCHEVIPNVFDIPNMMKRSTRTSFQEHIADDTLHTFFSVRLYFCELRTFFNVSQLRFRPSTKKLDLAFF